MYYILIEAKSDVSDLLRKYKTECWQMKIRDCESRETKVGPSRTHNT